MVELLLLVLKAEVVSCDTWDLLDTPTDPAGVEDASEDEGAAEAGVLQLADEQEATGMELDH